MNTERVILAVVAIIAICFLEYVAISAGIDGAIFGVAIAAISGLAGYEIRGRISNE